MSGWLSRKPALTMVSLLSGGVSAANAGMPNGNNNRGIKRRRIVHLPWVNSQPRGRLTQSKRMRHSHAARTIAADSHTVRSERQKPPEEQLHNCEMLGQLKTQLITPAPRYAPVHR
ncbi:exported hypothetical protein [uncultured Stenotrophomonas sp.]|uniref:Secreted protein n=1 Tax=uncultured Stenotrophomonas sp. TaxID=165438 RepID=A0A1Y5Q1Q4_9GAMM|nr:exported hypothetical protein [uncultured Stenotrophomonas sp.]